MWWRKLVRVPGKTHIHMKTAGRTALVQLPALTAHFEALWFCIFIHLHLSKSLNNTLFSEGVWSHLVSSQGWVIHFCLWTGLEDLWQKWRFTTLLLPLWRHFTCLVWWPVNNNNPGGIRNTEFSNKPVNVSLLSHKYHVQLIHRVVISPSFSIGNFFNWNYFGRKTVGCAMRKT